MKEIASPKIIAINQIVHAQLSFMISWLQKLEGKKKKDKL